MKNLLQRKKFQVGGYIDYPTNQYYTKIGNQIRDQIRGDSENPLISYDYYTWNQIPTEQKNQVRGNIAKALISRPTPGNLYNALRVWAGWEDPENPNLVKGIPPDVTGYKNPQFLKSFIIPAMNPAEAAAARDFMKTPEYKRFIKTNPGTIIETKARPGISSDWSYPQDVMIRHGLRKNPIKVTDQTSKIPEGKSGNYQKTYNQNLADDKREHIGKRQRRDFQQKIALSSSDGRRANAGKPNERNIRYVFDNIENYPQSVQKGLERVIKSIAKSADKQGITINREDMIKDSRVKRYLKEQLEQLKNGLLK